MAASTLSGQGRHQENHVWVQAWVLAARLAVHIGLCAVVVAITDSKRLAGGFFTYV
jgi:hypothetical protein